MMFSIIIPTLNEAVFISNLLSDLKNQSYKDFEVIVVDGNSDDGTKEKVSDWIKAIQKLNLIETNIRNVSHQRNLGAKKAKGEYLVFFDADVGLPEYFLSKIALNINKSKYILMTTNLVSNDGNLIHRMLLILANISRELLLCFKIPVVGGYNIIIEKNFFLSLDGFDEKMVHGEDVQLMLTALKKGVLLKNISDVVQYFSFRRFIQFGYFSTTLKMLHSAFYLYRRKNIYTPIFKYPMGGGQYTKKTNKK